MSTTESKEKNVLFTCAAFTHMRKYIYFAAFLFHIPTEIVCTCDSFVLVVLRFSTTSNSTSAYIIYLYSIAVAEYRKMLCRKVIFRLSARFNTNPSAYVCNYITCILVLYLCIMHYRYQYIMRKV